MNPNSKLILAGGVTAMALASIVLIFFKADKEYILIFTGFCGQFVAAFLTYINNNKPPPEA